MDTSAPGPTHHSTPTPAATSSPIPSEYAVTPGQPASRFGFECETLVDPALVSGLFSTEVAAADPIVTASGVGISIPRRTSILSVGGTVCEWSNGESNNDQYGPNPAYVGVVIAIVPRPADGWSGRAVRYGMPHEYSQCYDTACTASAAVGDAWVTVEGSGGEWSADDPAAWQRLVDAVVAAVDAAGLASAPSSSDRTSEPFPSECDSILSLDTVRSITSVPELVSHRMLAGGWSEWAEASYHAENVGCAWSLPDSESSVGQVHFVREGRWAFERMLQAGTAVPVELVGLAAEDEAVLRCEPDFGPHCAVDLRLGQDWFNVAASDEAMAIALAEAALAHLAS